MAKKKFLAPLLEEDLKQFKLNISKVSAELAEESVNFFQDNFRRQGFVDSGVIKWKKRKGEKRRTRGSKKLDNESRGILIKSGRMSNSIRRTNSNKKRIIIGTSGTANKYSGVHNYGLKAGRGKGFKMPQRKFIGHSWKLSKQLIKLINFRIRRSFK